MIVLGMLLAMVAYVFVVLELVDPGLGLGCWGLNRACADVGLGIGGLFLGAIHREQEYLRRLEGWFPEAAGPRCDDYTSWRASPLTGVACRVDEGPRRLAFDARMAALGMPALGRGRGYVPYWDRDE